MKILGCLLLCTTMAAQKLPEEPKPKELPQIPFAINGSIAERYNFQKGSFDLTPGISIDYRYHEFRFGVGVTHDIFANTYSVSASVNYKILQFGKVK